MGDPFGYESWHGIWELPCLNLYNQEVKNYLLDTVRFWVREFDIDGSVWTAPMFSISSL